MYRTASLASFLGATVFVAACSSAHTPAPVLIETTSEPTPPSATSSVAKHEAEAPKSARPERPQGYVEMKVASIEGPLPDSGIVVLATLDRAMTMSLAIGGTEALSIALRYSGRTYVRPLTHDLLDHAIHDLGARVAQVQIDDLQDGVFLGRIVLITADRIIDLDARPSDAIALALGNGVPIYVAKHVLDEAGERPGGRPDSPPEPHASR
jgi:uncharacterized protein